MDRETLSNYGWIIISVLILAVMISFATPFGSTIGNSVNDVVKIVTQNEDDNDNIKTVEELQEIYNFSYYSSFSDAVSDINNSTTSNANSDKDNAYVGIYKNNGKSNIVILQDTEISGVITIKNNTKINLGGNTLKLSGNGSYIEFNSDAECVIDGKLNGSKIYKEYTGGSALLYLIVQNGSNLTINGGTYSLISTSEETTANISSVIYQKSLSAYTEINDCEIIAKKQYNGNKYTLSGIRSAGGTFKINDSSISINTGSNTTLGNTYGIRNSNTNMIINSSEISIHGNDYSIYGINNQSSTTTINDTNINITTDNAVDTTGYGIRNYGGTLTFNSGSVTGLNGALLYENATTDTTTKLAKTYINGGTFASYYNEAIRLSHGEKDIAYIRNATIKCTDYAAFSVYETSNSSTYIDNCTLIGGQYAFALKNTNSESGNGVYISNTNIEEEKIIENSGENKLYIGKGTNITSSSVTNSSNIEFGTFDSIPGI